MQIVLSIVAKLTFFSCYIRYVHNNIFFSFAVDADLEQLSRKQSSDPNSKTESTSSSLNSSEKNSEKSSHGPVKVNGENKSSVSKTGDLNGVTDLATPDVAAETQLAESEQATYASANNDLKGTKAYQEADVPGLYNLAMAIIDYRGHRLVAQVCLLPGLNNLLLLFRNYLRAFLTLPPLFFTVF